MPIDRNDSDERQARLDAMIEDFRAAQQRQLVKRAKLLWSRAEAARQATACVAPTPPDHLH
jgi:hypothetical protein